MGQPGHLWRLQEKDLLEAQQVPHDFPVNSREEVHTLLMGSIMLL